MKKTILLIATVFIANAVYADQTEDPTVACVRAIEKKPEVQILKSKMTVISDRAPSLEMLSNNQKPNKAEKTALSALDGFLTECAELGKEWRQRSYQPQMTVLANQASCRSTQI